MGFFHIDSYLVYEFYPLKDKQPTIYEMGLDLFRQATRQWCIALPAPNICYCLLSCTSSIRVTGGSDDLLWIAVPNGVLKLGP